MKIYEACDCTSDEVHFPLGLWLTLEMAEKMFDTEDADDIHDESGCREDSLTVEIREREIGFSGFGKFVKKLEWRQTYDSVKDDYVWFKVKEPK
jgi:hypothetical protein